MKVIILAAGKGERLMPLTKNTPKPLLDMGNGNTLLEEQLHRMSESGAIDEIVLVIGYLADQVEAKLKMHINNGLKVRTIFNPFYEVSNNLMSLWLAKHEMNSGDFMITNGDNLFAPDVFAGLTTVEDDGIYLAISAKSEFDYDDMKVSLNGGSISKVSKQIEDADAKAESPGLCLIRGERARKIFSDNLETLARDGSFISKFWLETFNMLYEKGISVKPWWFDGKAKWQEVDFHLDVNRVKELIIKKAA
jgi:L-glutamine-phosphate cytidylyltransferase